MVVTIGPREQTRIAALELERIVVVDDGPRAETFLLLDQSLPETVIEEIH